MSVRRTRERIVKATRALHEEVGPAATTITAVAERAGVQRLTVYRHFPDDAALVGACSADWRADHPLPDPSGWTGLAEPGERLRRALAALYRYFADGAAMLERVLSDEGEMPSLAAVMAPWREYMREVAGGLSAGWGVSGAGSRRVRLAVGHAVRFETWRSLAEEGAGVDDAVQLMAMWVEGVARTGDPES
jgi:AcrR family transcriptional regulator